MESPIFVLLCVPCFQRQLSYFYFITLTILCNVDPCSLVINSERGLFRVYILGNGLEFSRFFSILKGMTLESVTIQKLKTA